MLPAISQMEDDRRCIDRMLFQRKHSLRNRGPHARDPIFWFDWIFDTAVGIFQMVWALVRKGFARARCDERRSIHKHREIDDEKYNAEKRREEKKKFRLEKIVDVVGRTLHKWAASKARERAPTRARTKRKRRKMKLRITLTVYGWFNELLNQCRLANANGKSARRPMHSATVANVLCFRRNARQHTRSVPVCAYRSIAITFAPTRHTNSAHETGKRERDIALLTTRLQRWRHVRNCSASTSNFALSFFFFFGGSWLAG